jgi:phasin family protein
MTKDADSYVEMLRGFGGKLGLPQIDVDKLIETNRKNIDALSESAMAAADGAQAVARKQREVLEAGLQEATALAKGFQPLGDPRETVARQTEFVKKVFEVAVQGARESAKVSRESTVEAVKVLQDRMKASIDEIRASVSRADKPSA